MIRAVLDVNVLISAFIGGADGPPRKLIYAWREGRFTLVVSPGLLNELATVLGRPKFARWSGNERAVLWIPLLDDPPDGVCVCVSNATPAWRDPEGAQQAQNGSGVELGVGDRARRQQSNQEWKSELAAARSSSAHWLPRREAMRVESPALCGRRARQRS